MPLQGMLLTGYDLVVERMLDHENIRCAGRGGGGVFDLELRALPRGRPSAINVKDRCSGPSPIPGR
ncbi:MAG: hypothetical protein ACLT98_11275 [Eggerthellaceae bacterium]